QVTIRNGFTTISLSTLVGRNFRLNCILEQELRRYDPRSRFPQKSPFRPHFRAFYPHPANKPSLRAEGATHSLAPGKPGWPPTSTWPLFSAPRPTPPSAGTGGVRPCANPPPLATACYQTP